MVMPPPPLIIHVEFLAFLGLEFLRRTTVNHQEMAEGPKIRERKCAKGLETKDFGKRTQN